MRQPLMWPKHGVALEARAFRLDILEDEGGVPRRRVHLLGSPRKETPALLEWLVTSLTIERVLLECHRRHISPISRHSHKNSRGRRDKPYICTISSARLRGRASSLLRTVCFTRRIPSQPSLQYFPQKSPFQPSYFPSKSLDLFPTVQGPPIINPQTLHHLLPRLVDPFIIHHILLQLPLLQLRLQRLNLFLHARPVQIS